MQSTSNHVCPWWMGYLLASPLRRLWHDPRRILALHVREGMTVLEPGPGMGFFTLDLAHRVGPAGKVIAIDVQPKMLDVLARRARKAGLMSRIELRQPEGDSLKLENLAGGVDFVLAFAVVHELPNAERFFKEAAAALKTGGTLLLAEPKGHVNAGDWSRTLHTARDAGLIERSKLAIPRSHATLLSKV